MDIITAKKMAKKWSITFEKMDFKWPQIQGHDNTTLILNDKFSFRFPTAKEYENQVIKEHIILDEIRKSITLKIPKQIFLGNPDVDFPFHWSINEWIHGEVSSKYKAMEWDKFVNGISKFLLELSKIEKKEIFSIPDKNNFYRGGKLSIYENEFLGSMNIIKSRKILSVSEFEFLMKVWQSAMSAENTIIKESFVHGDLNLDNILVNPKNGEINAIIDFGLMTYGDPACDYALAWSSLDSHHRTTLLKQTNCDHDLASRAKGWALWKAAISIAKEDKKFIRQANFTIKQLLNDYNEKK